MTPSGGLIGFIKTSQILNHAYKACGAFEVAHKFVGGFKAEQRLSLGSVPLS